MWPDLGGEARRVGKGEKGQSCVQTHVDSIEWVNPSGGSHWSEASGRTRRFHPTKLCTMSEFESDQMHGTAGTHLWWLSLSDWVTAAASMGTFKVRLEEGRAEVAGPSKSKCLPQISNLKSP